MTDGLVDAAGTPPILVLGLGNILLSDDGLGPLAVEELSRRCGNRDGSVEFLDGGTQGLALLGRLAGRKAVVIVDALSMGRVAGSVSVIERQDVLALGTKRAETAHEGNAEELLAAAAVLGDLPGQLYVIGVEPACLQTAMGLSPDVQGALNTVIEKAEDIVERLLLEIGEPVKL